MAKPTIIIVGSGEGNPLPALNALSSLKNGSSQHEQRDCRHPLGVYNISVSRICSKVEKCAARLELYWKGQPLADTNPDLDEIIDYLELTMYAAAEHVDDLEEIAKTFFKTDREAAKSPDLRLMKQAMKPLRDDISAFANTIKHAHGRFRLYEAEFVHGGYRLPVLGFFIEGWLDGGVGPHRLLHSGGKTVISVTSFLWSVLTYVGEMSTALSQFLSRINATDLDLEKTFNTAPFRTAAIKLSRLPVYSFDEDDPFTRVKWQFVLDDVFLREADSGIYGSIVTPWSKTSAGVFGGYRFMYASDGWTRSFKILHPATLKLSHWD